MSLRGVRERGWHYNYGALWVVAAEPSPMRFVAGTDAMDAVETQARDLLAQVDDHRDVSYSPAIDATRSG